MGRKNQRPKATVSLGVASPIVASIRGTPEWKTWLEDLAKANRQSVSGMIDLALADYARTRGFKPPPER
jgi:hypothetical protein